MLLAHRQVYTPAWILLDKLHSGGRTQTAYLPGTIHNHESTYARKPDSLINRVNCTEALANIYQKMIHILLFFITYLVDTDLYLFWKQQVAGPLLCDKHQDHFRLTSSSVLLTENTGACMLCQTNRTLWMTGNKHLHPFII